MPKDLTVACMQTPPDCVNYTSGYQTQSPRSAPPPPHCTPRSDQLDDFRPLSSCFGCPRQKSKLQAASCARSLPTWQVGEVTHLPRRKLIPRMMLASRSVFANGITALAKTPGCLGNESLERGYGLPPPVVPFGDHPLLGPRSPHFTASASHPAADRGHSGNAPCYA